MSKSESGGMLFLTGGRGDLSGELLIVASFYLSNYWRTKYTKKEKNLKYGGKMPIWVLKIQIWIFGGKNENLFLPYNWGSFELFGVLRWWDNFKNSKTFGIGPQIVALANFKFQAGKWNNHNLGSIANFIEFLKFSLHLNIPKSSKLP